MGSYVCGSVVKAPFAPVLYLDWGCDKAILASLYYARGENDKLIQSHTKNNIYNVNFGDLLAKKKSSKLVIANSSALSSFVPSRMWKAIWGLKAQPKVKYFLWKACKLALPTSDALFKSVSCLQSASSVVRKLKPIEHMIFFHD